MPFTVSFLNILALARQTTDLQVTTTTLSGADVTAGVILLVYLVIVLGSLFWTLRAYIQPIGSIKLTMSEDQIVSKTLPPDELDQVRKNFKDMGGALRYWKKQAAQAKYFHYYSLVWTTLGTILVPLALPYVRDSGYVQGLITIISLHTAVLLAFNRLLKPDRVFQSFRQIESNYYDLLRDILDRPYVVSKMAGGDDKRLDYFIETSKKYRLDARRMETAEYFPALDTTIAAQAVQQVSAPLGGQVATAASASVTVAQEQAVARAQVAVIQPGAQNYLPSAYNSSAQQITGTTITYSTSTAPASDPNVQAAYTPPIDTSAQAPYTPLSSDPSAQAAYTPPADPNAQTPPDSATGAG